MNNITEKKKYSSPRIEIIELDNDISLAMESTPPTGNGENTSFSKQAILDDPFKNQIG